MSVRPSFGGRGALFLAAAGLSAALFLQFCDLIFQCGCRAFWSGADAACNVHVAGTPNCPWCAHGALGSLPFVAVLVTQAVLAFAPMRGGWPIRIAATLLALPIVGGLGGLIFGLVDGYWAS